MNANERKFMNAIDALLQKRDIAWFDHKNRRSKRIICVHLRSFAVPNVFNERLQE
ncbi:MAG: hypothetical protein WD397_15465 [Wenzhouxiangellaceae bacterium]